MNKQTIDHDRKASARLRRPTLIAGWVCVVVMGGYVYIAADRSLSHKFLPMLIIVLVALVAGLAWGHRRNHW